MVLPSDCTTMLMVPSCGIGTFDGEGNALTFFVNSHDDELSGLLFVRYARSFE